MLALRKLGWKATVALGLGLAVLGAVSFGAVGAEPSDSQAAEALRPEKHPLIHRALRELRETKKTLEKADHDFGGHRREAIKDIDHAIVQLEKALKYDKK